MQQQDKRSYVPLWQGGPGTAVEKLFILQLHVNVVFICSGNTYDSLPDFYGLLGRKILLLAGPNKAMQQWLLPTMAEVRHCHSASAHFPTPELLIDVSSCSCLHFSQKKRGKIVCNLVRLKYQCAGLELTFWSLLEAVKSCLKMPQKMLNTPD